MKKMMNSAELCLTKATYDPELSLNCVAFTKVRSNLRYWFNELTKMVWLRQVLLSNLDLF